MRLKSMRDTDGQVAKSGVPVIKCFFYTLEEKTEVMYMYIIREISEGTCLARDHCKSTSGVRNIVFLFLPALET